MPPGLFGRVPPNHAGKLGAPGRSAAADVAEVAEVAEVAALAKLQHDDPGSGVDQGDG